MAFALNFDNRLKRRLDEEAPSCEWKAGWSAEGERWRVDVGGVRKKDSLLILVEVELKRQNPVGNVVKIWRWARDKKISKRILFLHAFSAHYTRGPRQDQRAAKQEHYDRSRFVGERMMEDGSLSIEYTTIRMPFKPRRARGGVRIKKGAGRMRHAADLLANKVARIVNSA